MRSELYSRTRFQGTARESVRTSRGVSFYFGYFSLRQVREKYLGHRDQPRLVVAVGDKWGTSMHIAASKEPIWNNEKSEYIVYHRPIKPE